MMTGDTGLRQAALLLHATAPAERCWLLAQLAQRERDALAVLLDELTRLGLPADARLLELAANLPEAPLQGKLASEFEAQFNAQSLSATQSCNEDQRHLAYLQQAPGHYLMRILQAEPVLLIALVLRCTSWHWQAALLQRLESSKRSALEKRLADSEDFPAAIKSAVLAALSEQVRLMMASKTALDTKPHAEADGRTKVDADTNAGPNAVADRTASYFAATRSRCLAYLDRLRWTLALTQRHIFRLIRTREKMKEES